MGPAWSQPGPLPAVPTLAECSADPDAVTGIGMGVQVLDRLEHATRAGWDQPPVRPYHQSLRGICLAIPRARNSRRFVREGYRSAHRVGARRYSRIRPRVLRDWSSAGRPEL